MADLYFRPLDRSTWIRDDAKRQKRCPFRSTYENTLRTLARELRHLKAARAVIELDIPEMDFRVDGMPRLNARVLSPKVRLSFEAPGIGPQTYMAETYQGWEDNLRGIALTLERLRAVERYGATRGKQQYRGWGALPAKAWDGFTSREEAVAFLARAAQVPAGRNGISLQELYRTAAAIHHPDKGGTDDMMAKINQAREVAAR